MQVYRGFDIGTDKPSLEARRAVPHHLFDVADPSEQFTAADFVTGALRAMDDIHGRQESPFHRRRHGPLHQGPAGRSFPRARPGSRGPSAAGGRSGREGPGNPLQAGWKRSIPPTPGRSGAGTKSGSSGPWRSSIPPGNPSLSISASTESFVKDARQIRIGLRLERQALYKRIEDRVERMFAGGLVEEVDRLLRQGVPEDAPPLRASATGGS